jgi:hypothetical protein
MKILSPGCELMKSGLGLQAASCDTVEIRYRAVFPAPVRSGGYLFFAAAGQAFAEERKFYLPKLVADGQPQRIVVGFRQLRGGEKAWRGCGVIDQVRLDITNDAPGQVELLSVRFTTAARRLQEVGQALLGAPGRRRVEGLDDEAVQEGASGFHVLGVAAVVADLRRGQRHDLPVIGRVGDDLLVARHPRVEDRFARHVAGRAARDARKDAPVRQRQIGMGCRVHRNQKWGIRRNRFRRLGAADTEQD